MNLQTTLALLFLLALLVGAWFAFAPDDTVVTDPAGRSQVEALFPDLLSAEVTSIALEDPSGGRYQQPVRFERRGEGWQVTCQALHRGKPLRARKERAQQILDVLQDVRSLRRVEGGAGRLAAFGLQPESRITITVHRRAGQPLTLHLGSDVEPSGMMVQRASDGSIHEVERGLREELLPPMKSIWDRSLIPLPVLATASIQRETVGGGTLELVREFSSWRLRSPFSGRADIQRCDTFRNSLMNTNIVAFAEKARLNEDALRPRYVLTITTKAPDKQLAVTFYQQIQEGVIAKVAGSEDHVFVSPDVLRQLEAPPEEFRDRRVMRIKKVSRVYVQDGDKETEIHLVKGRRRVRGARLRKEDAPGRLMDPLKWNDLFRRLSEFSVQRFIKAGEGGETPFKLVVEEGEGATKVVREFRFGPSRGDGLREVEIVGQGSRGLVLDRSLDFLRVPWFHFAVAAGHQGIAAHGINSIRIRGSEGREATFDTVLAKDGSVRITRKRDGARAPDELAEAVLTYLAFPRIERFAGENMPPATTGLDRPRLEITWSVSEKSSPKKIVPGGAAWWFRVGKPLDGTFTHAAMSRDEKLVLLVREQDLDAPRRLLAWALDR